MTRDEAIAKAAKFYADGGKHAVDLWAALGMLKLDEPKSAIEILEPLLGEYHALKAVGVLDLAGLKIVEK